MNSDCDFFKIFQVLFRRFDMSIDDSTEDNVILGVIASNDIDGPSRDIQFVFETNGELVAIGVKDEEEDEEEDEEPFIPLPSLAIWVDGQTLFELPTKDYDERSFALYLNSALQKKGKDYILSGDQLIWQTLDGLRLLTTDSLHYEYHLNTKEANDE